MTLRVMTRSSEDPASRSSAWLIRRPPPRNRKMFVCVMYRARLLYKPSPHCSWDQSVLLIHLLLTTRNNIIAEEFFVADKLINGALKISPYSSSDGYYDIIVIQRALEICEMESTPRIPTENPPENIIGYVINRGGHWLSLRKIGA